MTTWDSMEELAAVCRRYIDDVLRGAVPNGDPVALERFRREVAPRLSPLTLLVLVEAWQRENPRPPPAAVNWPRFRRERGDRA